MRLVCAGALVHYELIVGCQLEPEWPGRGQRGRCDECVRGTGTPVHYEYEQPFRERVVWVWPWGRCGECARVHSAYRVAVGWGWLRRARETHRVAFHSLSIL